MFDANRTSERLFTFETMVCNLLVHNFRLTELLQTVILLSLAKKGDVVASFLSWA